jgi:hypothetical protein
LLELSGNVLRYERSSDMADMGGTCDLRSTKWSQRDTSRTRNRVFERDWAIVCHFGSRAQLNPAWRERLSTPLQIGNYVDHLGNLETGETIDNGPTRSG